MINNVVTSPVDMNERKALGIRSGDTVRVWQKIEEKGKTRLQAFEGVVLARKHGGEAGGTFTVRKVSSGVGIERIFPLYSPAIDKIEIVKRAKTRRSKLYFIREKVARDLKRVLRRTEAVSIATKGSAELEEERKRVEAEELKRQEEEAQRESETQAQEEQKDSEEEITEGSEVGEAPADEKPKDEAPTEEGSDPEDVEDGKEEKSDSESTEENE